MSERDDFFRISTKLLRIGVISMENQGPLILDISSDEEAGFADIRKGGDCEFGDREDVDWLSKIWFELGGNMDDDSDDVVILSEEVAKSPQKSRLESLKPLTKLVDDDDDCIVLDGDPDKSIVVVNNKVDGGDDSDDLEIVGEKGEVRIFSFLLFYYYYFFRLFSTMLDIPL